MNAQARLDQIAVEHWQAGTPGDDDDWRPGEYELRRIHVAALLGKAARFHAPKLCWRSDDEITRLIESEIVPDARFIASALNPDERERVISEFEATLRDRIRWHGRKYR